MCVKSTLMQSKGKIIGTYKYRDCYQLVPASKKKCYSKMPCLANIAIKWRNSWEILVDAKLHHNPR